jgi:hypothetical protein
MTRIKPVPVDVATANREVRQWLRDIANVRVHATTKEQPVVRWQYERAMLLPFCPLVTTARGSTLRSRQTRSSFRCRWNRFSTRCRYHDLALEVAP